MNVNYYKEIDSRGYLANIVLEKQKKHIEIAYNLHSLILIMIS